MEPRQPVILCVDDDRDVLEALSAFLGPRGFRVVTALDASEAVAAWRRESPDFILLDLMMEEMDTGFRLACSLRSMGNTAPVALLSSTGDACCQNIDPADCGVVCFLQKPVRFDQLAAVIDAALGRH